MKKPIFALYSILLLSLLFTKCSSPASQKNTMQTNRFDYDKVFSELKELLSAQKLDIEQPFQLFLRAFKKEEILEVYAKKSEEQAFHLIHSYDFCASSGTLGPKRKEGDKQIPEGLYHIDRFNPKSQFHLSLGLNYPNESDKIKGDPKEPGSDIFIHGGCMTVGCIPITNQGIEWLYVLADKARELGQSKIHIHIFPTRMEPDNLGEILRDFPQHRDFWKELQEGYRYFEEKKTLPNSDAE